MNLQDLLKDGAIKRFQPRGTQVKALLESAESDLEAAKEILELKHYGLSRDTAYEVMLKAGMALMFKSGYRPEAGRHNITIVRFTEHAFGPEHRPLIDAFDRLRRSRHERLYRGKELATKSQAVRAIENAQKLLL